jgi:hypothetical protein
MTDDRTRTPHDGKPYFCAVCGDGLAEFVSCELAECELETTAAAEARRAEQLLREARAH